MIAKGARKGGSRLSGSSEPLTRGVFTWAEGRQRRFVTSVNPITSYPALRADYMRLICGLALAEVAALSLPDQAPAPEIYHLVCQGLERLTTDRDQVIVLIWVLDKLMEAEGQAPNWTRCSLTDSPLRETPAAVSARAGGFVSPEAGFVADVFLVPAEALIALERLKERPEPPTKIPYSKECLRVLVTIWQGMLQHPLPALQSVFQEISNSYQ